MAEVDQFDVRSGPKRWQRWDNRMAVVIMGFSLLNKASNLAFNGGLPTKSIINAIQNDLET